MTRRANLPPIVSGIFCLVLTGSLGVTACGDDDGGGGSSQRGAPNKPGGSSSKSQRGSRSEGGGGDSATDEGPERPPLSLDEKSFTRRRDPFRSFVVTERLAPEPDTPRAARTLKLGQYAFEDLRLVIIVNSGRGIKPRAQFVGGDGRSGTVLQGEHFSSAEVLLAAVNRDYVEVEVVDEELASTLGLRRGERRTIFLRNE